MHPGPRNLITDVPGIAVGNAEDRGVRSGVTVVLPDKPAVAAVSVAGGAPGTRETALLDPACLVDRVDAIVLSGGSAYGLDAASGVMAWLGARGRGFRIGGAAVPIVPAAILFDLLNGGDKDWGEEPPYRRLGRAALEAAGAGFALGNAGAGLGARAGMLKGGLGSASVAAPDGLIVGALAAVNARGEVVMPGTPCFWAWALERAGEFGGLRPAPDAVIDIDAEPRKPLAASGAAAALANTTLGVVATNARLTKAEATRIAIMAQDGFARAIRPAHTPLDGDTVFVLATGERREQTDSLARIGMLAGDCLARAVARGVYCAESLGDTKSWREVHGAAAGRP